MKVTKRVKAGEEAFVIVLTRTEAQKVCDGMGSVAPIDQKLGSDLADKLAVLLKS